MTDEDRAAVIEAECYDLPALEAEQHLPRPPPPAPRE